MGSPPSRLLLRLPLDPARLLRARHRVRDYLDGCGLQADDVDDMVLVVEEAMTNAMRHSGAVQDLEVRLSFEGGDLIAEVADRGRGLEGAAVDWSAPSDPLQRGGRGLLLIRSLSDEVDLVSDDGLLVRARKQDVLAARPSCSTSLEARAPGADAHRDPRHRALLDELPEAYAAFDWEFRYVYVNSAACAMAGVSRENLLGRTLWEVFPSVPGTEVERRLRDAMELGIPGSYEFYFPPLESWFEQRLYPTATGISQFTSDITGRKRRELEREEVEAALRESERRLRIAQDATRLGVHEYDVSSGALTWDQRTRELWGVAPDDVVTYDTFMTAVHPDDRERTQVAVDRAFDPQGDARYDATYRVIDQVDGRERWVHATGLVLREEAGPRLIGTVEDVSEDVRLRDRLEGALDEQTTLARENARLFEEQQWIATTLQEHLIHRLPAVGGLELAVRSLPARRPDLVGGDFSDAFRLSDGRVLLVIGDVAGKGVRAAGMTETVRSAMRAFASIDGAPSFILRKTNELLLADPDEAHVTALVCVIDPATGEATAASAGHPPPVYLSPSSCHLLDMPFRMPLRSFRGEYPSIGLALAEGDCLVLYTDGVTDARHGREFFGEERLVDAVAELRGRPAAEVAQRVTDAALSFADGLRDDVHVVAVRLG